MSISCLQAIPRALRTSKRTCRLFGCYVTVSPLTIGGCSSKNVGGKDIHSDKECAMFFNPIFLKKPQYDDLGMHLLVYL